MQRIMLMLLTALLATPVAAQEWQVAREQFPFVGTRLTIDVDVDAPGTLRLIRGQPGSVRVASRSRDGFTSSGLADSDRLTLAGAGAGPVDYLVAVPENVWVEVQLPDRSLGRGVARGESGSWEWQTDERSPGAPVTEWVPGTDADPASTAGAPGDELLYTTFTRELAPETIELPDLDLVERVAVRIQGRRFKVITSRPLSVDEGGSRRLVIRPARRPMDIVLTLPVSTANFRLRLGDHTALILHGRSVTTLCTPVTEQRLSNDRLWFTFNPLDGALSCGGQNVQRHGG